MAATDIAISTPLQSTQQFPIKIEEKMLLESPKLSGYSTEAETNKEDLIKKWSNQNFSSNMNDMPSYQNKTEVEQMQLQSPPFNPTPIHQTHHHPLDLNPHCLFQDLTLAQSRRASTDPLFQQQQMQQLQQNATLVRVQVVLLFQPQNERELIPDLPLRCDMFSNVNLVELLTSIRSLGFHLNYSMIFFYNPQTESYIFCGNDVLNISPEVYISPNEYQVTDQYGHTTNKIQFRIRKCEAEPEQTVQPKATTHSSGEGQFYVCSVCQQMSPAHTTLNMAADSHNQNTPLIHSDTSTSSTGTNQIVQLHNANEASNSPAIKLQKLHQQQQLDLSQVCQLIQQQVQIANHSASSSSISTANLSISNIQNKAEGGDCNNTNANANATLSLPVKVDRGRRNKERRIGVIVEKVRFWRNLFTQGKQAAMVQPPADMTEDQYGLLRACQNQRFTLEQAAKVVGIAKKSLDDYYLQIRFAKKFDFDFTKHQGDKFGVLRSFVKRKKGIMPKKKIKKSELMLQMRLQQTKALLEQSQFQQIQQQSQMHLASETAYNDKANQVKIEMVAQELNDHDNQIHKSNITEQKNDIQIKFENL